MTEAERARITAHALSVIASDEPDDAAVVEAMAKAGYESLVEPVIRDWEGEPSWMRDHWLTYARAAIAAYRDYQESF